MTSASTTPDFTLPPLTRIIATIGPASSSTEVATRLITAGASVFRLNFGHGSLEEHTRSAQTIRAASARLHQPAAIFGDLQGPKIRVGPAVDGGVELENGSRVIVQRQPVTAQPAETGEPIRLSTNHSELIDDVAPGHRVLIGDGAVRMLVVEKSRDELICTVTHGGIVTSSKGINLPDTDLSVKTLTGRDWEHVEWAVQHDMDFLALSFVRRADDVRELAEGIERIAGRLGRWPLRLPIIAKIELPRAVENIEEIADAADAIMVARGDLGVEMDLAEVPIVQKRLMATAQDYGKPVIIATQMLESMIDEPTPTRAEANDVATAILDQTDAVMLSGETAIGKYPIIAVEHMRRIALVTERFLASQPAVPSPPRKLVASRYRTAALAHGVWTVAQDIGAKCIVVWSQAGGGARYLSQNNFHIPIIAVTSNERAARQMQLLRGVTPLYMATPTGLSAFTRFADRYLQESGRVERGDNCILVAGEPLGQVGSTNTLAIHIVGNPDTGYAHHR